MKILKSLLTKYMLIVITAIFLTQIIVISFSLILMNTDLWTENDTFSKERIESLWHEEAGELEANKEDVEAFFSKWKKEYPKSSMFWVNGQGKLQVEKEVTEKLPTHWSATYTASFIKERYDGDPFTVIAFIGKDETNGFLVFEIPRNMLNKPIYESYEKSFIVIGIGSVLLFILLSFLFFRGIQKRLVHLQEAMEIRDVDDLPVPIHIKKQDEIGQLEQSFNRMIDELKVSKQREREEEQLRRKLIANLSHDLRTPLTKIQATIYTLTKVELSDEAIETIKTMEKSIKSMDELIDNLMSYTLLTASKYTYEAKAIDLIRFLRTSLATWYPLFEKEHFSIDIDLHPFSSKWHVDPLWMERVLDNLFQNILRHASDGKYLQVTTEATTTSETIVISDRGKGMDQDSKKAGQGIGLSIVDMMIRGMDLSWGITSNNTGTTVKIIHFL